MSEPEFSTFRLQSCPKGYTLDQDKTTDPLTTVKKAFAGLEKRYDLSHLKIERRQDAIEGAYSFSSLSDQLQASGKGLTPEQSQASAIMEFVERYSWLHFDYRNYEGYTVTTFNELQKAGVATFPENYFLNNFLNLADKPALLKEIKEIPLKWVKSVSLPDYQKVYCPINWHNYLFASNGLATGNAIEEALLQGLCEVIERENTYRLFGDKLIGNDVDQLAIDNPLINTVLVNAKRNGIHFILKDISYDLGIPTFAAYGICPAEKGLLTYAGCGYGTHVEPHKALIRALSEYFEGYSLLKKAQTELDIDWHRIVPRLPARNHGFLALYNKGMLLERNKVVKLRDLKDWSRPDIRDELLDLLKALRRHGHHAYFIDKTMPDLKVPVVRVMVPTMRNLVGSEYEDVWVIISQVYFEAGRDKEAELFLRKSVQRNAFLPAEMAIYAKPKNIFKEDYKATINYYVGFKKDAVELLKKYAAGLK